MNLFFFLPVKKNQSVFSLEKKLQYNCISREVFTASEKVIIT